MFCTVFSNVFAGQLILLFINANHTLYILYIYSNTYFCEISQKIVPIIYFIAAINTSLQFFFFLSLIGYETKIAPFLVTEKLQHNRFIWKCQSLN